MLQNVLVRVQPRPSGEAIITVAGERIAPAVGGTYEAFRTMTPVYLAMNEDDRYDLTTRRAVGASDRRCPGDTGRFHFDTCAPLEMSHTRRVPSSALDASRWPSPLRCSRGWPPA